MKVTLNIKLEDGFKDDEIGKKLLAVEGLKTPNPVKKLSKSQLILNLDRAITQTKFYDEVYPKIKDALKDDVKDWEGHDFED